MRQILQSLKNGTVELAEIPVPLVKPGHLLIKTTRSLISLGTERMLIEFGKAGWIEKARQQPDKVKQVIQKVKTDGLLPTVNAVFSKLDQPLALGYSSAGVVIEVGKGVSGYTVGDRVVSNGNHAEIVCVPEHLCARIPDGVDDVSAAFTVVSAIALQGVRLINPTLGESVAVMGLGLIGLITCQILRANGCRVIGFDFDPHKVAVAQSFGAQAFCLKDGIDPVATATDFSGGFGVDGVIITAATRSNDPIHQAPQMCRKRGRVVLVGVIGLEMSRDDFYKKEISFQVSCSYGPGRYDPPYEKKGLDYPIGFVRWTEQRNFQAVLQLMADGRLCTEDIVSRSIPFDAALEAYAKVSDDTSALGIILEYSGAVDPDQHTVDLSPTPISSASPAGPANPVVGFIGAGNYAKSTLIPAFQAAGVTLRTIASSSGVSGTFLGKKNGFSKSTTDYGSILTDPQINTVVITTQHDSHARFVIEALASGKHVFVEKPLCLTREELDNINQMLARKAMPEGLHLMVGFNRRFAPLTQTVKRLIGPVREPKSFIMTVNAGAIPTEHWTQDAQFGGGRLIGEACHFIDLVRFLADSPIDQIQTLRMTPPQGGSAPPDTATITMTFADGSLGTVHYFANGNKGFPKERLEVFCAGKILQLDNFIELTGYGWDAFKGEKLWMQDKGHKACVQAFADAIREGRSTPIPLCDLISVTSASFACAGITL
jgi:predicted dehydrogenase/threonine dehydrogenase-like Zn-dependent dehydrogenase